MNLVSPTMIRYVNTSSNNGSLRYKKKFNSPSCWDF